MTTITINQDLDLTKTSFENLKEAIAWFAAYKIDESPLSPEIITKGSSTEKEIDSPHSTFKPANASDKNYIDPDFQDTIVTHEMVKKPVKHSNSSKTTQRNSSNPVHERLP